MQQQPNSPDMTPMVSILCKLYDMLCDCRKAYPELAQLLDPKFHLEDCPYRTHLDKVSFKI